MSSSIRRKLDDSPRLLNRPSLSPKKITEREDNKELTKELRRSSSGEYEIEMSTKMIAKKISVDIEVFDDDNDDGNNMELRIPGDFFERRSSSLESVASENSTASSETHLLPIRGKPRSMSVESSASSNDSGFYSPMNSPLSVARNRRHSICVTIDAADMKDNMIRRQINIEDVEDRFRIRTGRERPLSAVPKASEKWLDTIAKKQSQGKTERKRNIKKFDDWLAEKAAYERHQIEQRRALEVVAALETAKNARERLSRGTSFDEWLEHKQKTAIKSRKASKAGHEGGNMKDEARRRESTQKYDEWLKMKFQQEMKHEQELIQEQRLRLKKIKKDASKKERK